jgi:hypothetical protein
LQLLEPATISVKARFQANIMPPTPAPAVIQSVDDFLRELGAIGFVGARQRHVRVWFRDQPESGLPLQPGVYRPTFPAANEAERLLTEQHLAQDFRVESAGLLTGRERDDELYFLQQHYRFPTRLLDWTHNPLASLFSPWANQILMVKYFLWMPTKWIRQDLPISVLRPHGTLFLRRPWTKLWTGTKELAFLIS